jgi:hypothetical protein
MLRVAEKRVLRIIFGLERKLEKARKNCTLKMQDLMFSQ